MKIWQIFLFGLIIFEIIADIFVKYYSLSNKWYLAAMGLLCYVIANMSWIYSMKLNSSLAVGANIFAISTGIIALIIGVVFFQEMVTTKQLIGMFLGAVSLILILF